MGTAQNLSQRQFLKSKIRKQKRIRNIQIAVFVFGLVLLGKGLFLFLQEQPLQTDLAYRPQDVVNAEPLFAIREMDGPKLNEISFLPRGGPQPSIAVSEDFYNFGVIGSKDVVTYEFAILNQGEAPLTLSRAYTTCGCTTAMFSASVIPPGKVSLMTLTLDAGYHDVAGQTVRRGVIIENNNPNNPSIEIWTQASVSQN